MKNNNHSILDFCFCFVFLIFCLCFCAFVQMQRWQFDDERVDLCESFTKNIVLNVGNSFVWICTFWFVRHCWCCVVYFVFRVDSKCSHPSNVRIEFWMPSFWHHFFRVSFSVSKCGDRKGNQNECVKCELWIFFFFQKMSMHCPFLFNTQHSFHALY